MRIGTWNLDGRWDETRQAFVSGLGCDVLLLTEVPGALAGISGRVEVSSGRMTRGQCFAAVAGRVEPDPASAGRLPLHAAAACCDGVTYLSSVLPWRSSGAADGYEGTSQGERTRRAVTSLAGSWPPGEVVWGGDWNHELNGQIGAGSTLGRVAVLELVEQHGMQVPTAVLGAHGGFGAIDHIAVPRSWTIRTVERHEAAASGRRLSDHDAYVVEVDR